MGLREVTVGKQRHRETKRQIQRSPTNTTNAATPLLVLEVTQEGRMVNQQRVKGQKMDDMRKTKLKLLKVTEKGKALLLQLGQ